MTKFKIGDTVKYVGYKSDLKNMLGEVKVIDGEFAGVSFPGFSGGLSDDNDKTIWMCTAKELEPPVTPEEQANFEESQAAMARGVDVGFVLGAGDAMPNNLANLRADKLHVPGAKDDNDKPEMSLVLHGFADALIEVGKVATFGAKKYTRDGWKSVPDGIRRYTDAGMRHQLAEASEAHDKESGLLHASHAVWNALARLQLMLKEGKA